MDDSGKDLSIDEQAISNRSLNQEKATNNLRDLQKHIFQPKYLDFPKSSAGDSHWIGSSTKSSDIDVKSSVKDSICTTTFGRPSSNERSTSDFTDSKLFKRKFDSSSYTHPLTDSTSWCNPSEDISRNTAAMGSGGKEIILNEGRANFCFRQSSVNDEELFGYGNSLTNQNHENPEQVDDYTLNVENNKSENLEDVNSALPNFGLLESSSGSESESAKSPKSFKSIEGNKVESEKKYISEEKHSHIKFSDGQDSDFKMRYQEKRSISAIDKREKYRISSGGEVFDPDIEFIEGECFPRHKIIQSNSLPDLVTSLNQSPFSPPRFNSNPSPRPTVEENLGKQYEFKKILEGTSSMPLSKEKPKIRRSVSIKEEPEFFPAENNNTDQDEENQNTSSKETDERRRILSSGYQTASSEAGSQDKSEITTSRQTSQLSQSSSGVWISLETENENAESVVDKAVGASVKEISSKGDHSVATNLSLRNNSYSSEINRSSPLSFVSGGNESNSTESSVKTVCEGQEIIDKTNHISSGSTAMSSHLQINDKSSSGDLPNLSILGTTSRNEDSSRNFIRLLSKDEKYGARSKIPLSGDIKPPDSFDPQSHGNLPIFLTMPDSFSLKPSSLDKVKEEDDKNHKFFLQNYTGEASGGEGQATLQGSMPTGSQRSSLCSQPSPSEAVKRMEEMLLVHDNFSPSILDKLLDVVIFSPYSNNERENIEGAGSQNFKDFTLDELQRASRCNFPACKELCCLKMCDILRVLNIDIPHLDSSYKLVKNYYTALYQHYRFTCDETKCPILFCTEFSEEWERQYQYAKDPVKLFVEDVQRKFRNPTMKLFLQSSNKFHKLQSHIQKDEMKEFETHIPLFPLGRFGTSNVCMDNKLQKLVVLTFYPLMENDHQLSLYTRLKDLNHPHIVPQYWMLEYEDKIQVCSLFCQGGSLEEYLSHAKELSWQRAFHYMKQILQAVIHLNSIGVVYLNWQSGNMLFPDDRRNIIQVGNFSLACPINCQCDIDLVRECLPYNMCPPEVLEFEYKADCRSDIWGAGCLLYEMFAGTPFLHEYRHEKGEIVHRQIRNGSLPNTDSWRVEIKKILQSCWKMKMEERGSLERIFKYIKSLRIR